MNIYDYLVWRGDVPFSLAPFNPVDNLILSRLSYTRFNGIVSVAPVPLGEATQAVRLWLAQLSSDERRAFTNALFDVLEASGAKTLDGIKQNWRSAVPAMIRELRKIDIQSAAMLLEISNAFIRAALRVKEADEPKLNP